MTIYAEISFPWLCLGKPPIPFQSGSLRYLFQTFLSGPLISLYFNALVISQITSALHQSTSHRERKNRYASPV